MDPPSIAPFTGLIHAPRLKDRFATNFVTTDRFYEDAETAGASHLPASSTNPYPTSNLDELKGGEALATVRESLGHLFPGLTRSG